MDQREFLRQMEELVDFGRTKENLLTKKEIADYCCKDVNSNELVKLIERMVLCE